MTAERLSQNPTAAALLRRLITHRQGIRGVPRLAYVTRRALFGGEATRTVTTPQGDPITIDLDDYGQIMHFYFPYAPELRALFADVLQPGDHCVDLGANDGVLSAVLARIVGETGSVLAVDPNPANIAQIQQTVQRANLTAVRPLAAAVAGEDGTATFAVPQGTNSESGEVRQSGDGLTVRTLRVATMLAEVGIDTPVTFIKYDVEGAEADLFASLQGLFDSQQRPVLLVEYHPEKIQGRGANTEDIRQSLYAIGYEERQVTPAPGGYRLSHPPAPLPDRANLLYITPDDLPKYPRLAKQWQPTTGHHTEE